MLFNSVEFLVFLPLVLIIYWCLNRNLRLQNVFILAASYVFYAWWDWRCLGLIVFTSVCSWVCGLAIETANDRGNVKRSKCLSALNICINLGILAFFKYYNFFVESFVSAFSFMGMELGIRTLKIVLPVGVSFYTFQALSYSIDVYRRQMQACRNVVTFCAYISFFPQLVAGPIERAVNLLPQFERKRHVNADSVTDGLRQILWGFFKKMVVADSCGSVTDEVFSQYGLYHGSTLVLGAILFSFQIYCDFSGYSDIAIGTSRLFGFNLKQNFRFPFFSRNMSEFWRRWHISLNTWFRDYVYIPMGGNRVSKALHIRNVFVVYLLSGLWHGADWSFVLWGAMLAVFCLPTMLSGKKKRFSDTVSQSKLLPSFSEAMSMLLTFLLFTFAFIFFRADNIGAACGYIANIWSPDILSVPRFRGATNVSAIFSLAFIAFMLVVEWLSREGQYGLDFKDKSNRSGHMILYTIVFALIYCFGVNAANFIYFQF